MSATITANELKTRGIRAIDRAMEDSGEAFITVRGKPEFVVLPVRSYNKFRELELEIAIQESRRDLKKGKFRRGSAAEHIKRIRNA